MNKLTEIIAEYKNTFLLICGILNTDEKEREIKVLYQKYAIVFVSLELLIS